MKTFSDSVALAIHQAYVRGVDRREIRDAFIHAADLLRHSILTVPTFELRRRALRVESLMQEGMTLQEASDVLRQEMEVR